MDTKASSLFVLMVCLNPFPLWIINTTSRHFCRLKKRHAISFINFTLLCCILARGLECYKCRGETLDECTESQFEVSCASYVSQCYYMWTKQSSEQKELYFKDCLYFPKCDLNYFYPCFLQGAETQVKCCTGDLCN